MSSNEDNELIQIEETEVVAPVKKPKRQMSDAQLASLAKGRATRIANAKTKSLEIDAHHQSSNHPLKKSPHLPPRLRRNVSKRLCMLILKVKVKKRLSIRNVQKRKSPLRWHHPQPFIHLPLHLYSVFVECDNHFYNICFLL
jgi:hypothetical protein